MDAHAQSSVASATVTVQLIILHAKRYVLTTVLSCVCECMCV